MKWLWSGNRETVGCLFYPHGRKADLPSLHFSLSPCRPDLRGRSTSHIFTSNEYNQVQYRRCHEFSPGNRRSGSSSLAFEWRHEVLQNSHHADNSTLARREWCVGLRETKCRHYGKKDISIIPRTIPSTQRSSEYYYFQRQGTSSVGIDNSFLL